MIDKKMKRLYAFIKAVDIICVAFKSNAKKLIGNVICNIEEDSIG